ncbi:hypothetical protein ACFT2C_06815 [Promicromonospora sp. NPDC057138]|uniref:hypothetical protein n=1 Tax=Promicromonospora sp. NPDC057138 TaxID=3346031 RepID=UPI003635A747
MHATLRRLLSALAALALLGGGLLALAPAAAADVTYVPDSWNGKVVYLSQACHDRGDTVCHTNTGCDGFSENVNSYYLAVTATHQRDPDHMNLLERGYKVVRGNGLTRENIANSNRVGADLHLPLHSNAISTSCETGFSAERYGTQVMYVSSAGSRCAEIMATRIGPSGPGTNDVRRYRTDLGELNQTKAVACYLEQEFHVWNEGVSWMRNRADWSWRVGLGVDLYMGYP